jgi:hypothetical protein
LLLTETRRVVPATRSRTNTSPVLKVSPGTRSDALEKNATYRPSPEIAGSAAKSLAWAPLLLTDTRRVVPADRSRTNTSWPLVSPGTKFEALEAKATYLPGVGPVTAQKILDWRSTHGAFSAVDELLEIDGIGDSTPRNGALGNRLLART